MSPEPNSKIAETVLLYLRDSSDAAQSSDGFVEVCAQDFKIIDYVIFAQQLDILRIQKLINWNPKSDAFLWTFDDEIQGITSKVSIAITPEGKAFIKSIPNQA